jgi:hypothetical protein
MTCPRWLALALLLALMVPPAAHAQSPAALTVASPAGGPAEASCLDRIADSTLVPEVLYLYASEMNDLTAASRAHVFDIDIFAQNVAVRFRELLRAPPGSLPAGEPAITWRTRESEVHIVVDPTGHFVAKPGSDKTNADIRARLPRSRLLATAVDSLRADGELFIFTGLQPDSLVFDLNLEPVGIGPDGKPDRLGKRAGFAVATLRMPPEKSAAVRKMTAPRYPERQRQTLTEAKIYMDFVVDTAGHADSTTIREFWPKYLPPLTGADKGRYADFLDVVRASILAATFEPARIGGCTVRQLVRQPFTFKLSGS